MFTDPALNILFGSCAVLFGAVPSLAELFEPLPEEKPDEQLISGIASELAKNIGETRQSGHNVIFASIALRALHDHPEYATPSIVTGSGRPAP